jgi:hypothetical protein
VLSPFAIFWNLKTEGRRLRMTSPDKRVHSLREDKTFDFHIKPKGRAERFESELHPNGRRRSTIPSLEPNDLSIALTLRVEDIRLLLGADLEESGRPDFGWQAVIDRFASTDNSHQGLKVPHHGSVNGHHDELWPKLLQNDAWAVLTPYSRGKKRLPQDSDIQRIRSQTPNSYSSARRTRTKYRHADPTVQRQLREMGVDLLMEYPSQGQVRLRKKLSGACHDWTVEFFGDACELADLL